MKHEQNEQGLARCGASLMRGDSTTRTKRSVTCPRCHALPTAECGKTLNGNLRCIRRINHVAPCSPVIFKGESS